MTNYHHVLAALELEGHDDAVIAAAKRLATAHAAELSLVTVVQPIAHLVSGVDTITEAGFAARLQQAARLALRELCRRNRVAAECAHVVRGSIHAAIGEFAAEQRVDLVVVGAHERHGLELFLGTTAASILQSAPCDVLGVRLSDAPSHYRRIVVAIDGTADCTAVIDRAVAFAQDAELSFITVLKSLFPVGSVEANDAAAAGPVKDLINKMQHKRIEAAQGWLDRAAIQARIEALHGTPSQEIKRYLQRKSADLVIVGSGAQAGAGWMIGSTTNNVLHGSPCDTLVVRHPS